MARMRVFHKATIAALALRKSHSRSQPRARLPLMQNKSSTRVGRRAISTRLHDPMITRRPSPADCEWSAAGRRTGRRSTALQGLANVTRPGPAGPGRAECVSTRRKRARGRARPNRSGQRRPGRSRPRRSRTCRSRRTAPPRRRGGRCRWPRRGHTSRTRRPG